MNIGQTTTVAQVIVSEHSIWHSFRILLTGLFTSIQGS